MNHSGARGCKGKQLLSNSYYVIVDINAQYNKVIEDLFPNIWDAEYELRINLWDNKAVAITEEEYIDNWNKHYCEL